MAEDRLDVLYCDRRAGADDGDWLVDGFDRGPDQARPVGRQTVPGEGYPRRLVHRTALAALLAALAFLQQDGGLEAVRFRRDREDVEERLQVAGEIVGVEEHLRPHEAA